MKKLIDLNENLIVIRDRQNAETYRRFMRRQFTTTQAFTESYCLSPEYEEYMQAVGRCYDVADPEYRQCGGLGITLPPEWLMDFRAFLKDTQHSGGQVA
jgi:hypothetical protein